MNSVEFFFVGWWPLVRILVVGTLLFLAVVLLLRISGNRTLSSLTTFDFIVAVAVGAVFGRAVTARDLSLSEALLAVTLLLVLQYLLSRLKRGAPGIARLLTASPVVLYERGAWRSEALRRENLSPEDVMAAVRAHGHASLDDVVMIVLEANGSISVVRPSP